MIWQIIAALLMLVGINLLAIDAKTMPQPVTKPPTSQQFTFTQPGEQGAFDPSAVDGGSGTVYMAYTSATALGSAPGFSTRLATTTNGGSTFTDYGATPYVTSNFTGPPAGIWNYEVPTLVHDTAAPASEAWKIFALRYMTISGSANFTLAWIAEIASSSPTGPWSSERKMFAGAAYNTQLNVIIGAPENTTFGGALSACNAYTEPAAYSDGVALYLAMSCATATGDTSQMFLLKRSYPAATWALQGNIFTSADAPTSPAGMKGLTAGNIFANNGKTYIVASPTDNSTYYGCNVYQFASLDAGTIVSTSSQLKPGSGVKTVLASIPKNPSANLTGACTFSSALSNAGIIYFDRFATGTPQTYLTKSFITSF